MTLDPHTPDHGIRFDCALMRADNLALESRTHKKFIIILMKGYIFQIKFDLVSVALNIKPIYYFV